MSRNSKNAKRMVTAREMSKQRQAGNPGPKKTTPAHGKKRAWFQLFDTYSAYLASKTKKPARKDKHDTAPA